MHEAQRKLIYTGHFNETIQRVLTRKFRCTRNTSETDKSRVQLNYESSGKRFRQKTHIKYKSDGL